MYSNKKVYNFEVADWHTYFVGVLAWLVHNADKCLSEAFKYASEYGYDSYKALRAAILKKVGTGSGLEVHHLFEKRLREAFEKVPKAEDMLAMVLTKEEHRVFTNAWREAIPYGTKYKDLTQEYIEKKAKKIYKDYPKILEALNLK